MAKVTNLNGMKDNYPPSEYKTWKEWWEDKKGSKFSKCSGILCTKDATVGAPVNKVDGDNTWYIVPLCDGCNKNPPTRQFEVSDADLEAIK